MKQCDALDGLVDRIISEPDYCNFDPLPLLCANGTTTGCLNQAQIEALYDIYTPMFDSKGRFLFPRVDPGSEDNGGWAAVLAGQINIYTDVGDSLRYQSTIV
jgi:feruloyl esterase